jgi:hypothetical protein
VRGLNDEESRNDFEDEDEFELEDDDADAIDAAINSAKVAELSMGELSRDSILRDLKKQFERKKTLGRGGTRSFTEQVLLSGLHHF